MQWFAWALRRRVVHNGARFVCIAVVLGPLMSGLLLSRVFGMLSRRSGGPLEFLATEAGFAIGGYIFGIVPAAIASMLIVARRSISFLEALLITATTTFLVFFIFISASSWLTRLSEAATLGLTLVLVSLPAAIGVGLLAAWWGAFTPRRSVEGEGGRGARYAGPTSAPPDPFA